MPPEQNRAHREHHESIRRTKQLLRWLPRRARLHKYPLIGRFAAYARSRSYLWSFRTEHVRGGLYLGSILALMPTLGVQLPISLLLAVLLRLNFMVVGGLQFITNPVTAPAVYYGTYQLGHAIITSSGLGGSVAIEEKAPPFDAAKFLGLEDRPVTTPTSPGSTRPSPNSELQTSNSELPSPNLDPRSPTAATADDSDAAPAELKWTRRFGTTINALVLGAVIGGLALGFVLDLLWRFAVARVERRLAARRRVLQQRSASTPPAPPPS